MHRFSKADLCTGAGDTARRDHDLWPGSSARGQAGAARAVGRAMAANPFAILVPCHRVVARSGLGGYLWGTEMKEKLLRLERESNRDDSEADERP